MTQVLIDRATLEQLIHGVEMGFDFNDGDVFGVMSNDMTDALSEGRAALANAEPTGWQPIDTAPKDGTLVVVYSPNGPDDWPDSLKVAFDYVCPDYEDWFYHCESYEHYMAVGGSNACGPDAVCTGPSQKAPYTHWMPLPAAPKEQP